MQGGLNTEGLKIILNQLQQSVIKIKNGDIIGSGFLCSIPFHNKALPAIITNDHILNENDISIGKKINFTLNNDKNKFVIFIGEKRKVYTNKYYDIAIIEIKNIDGLDISSFLEVDQNIFNVEEKNLGGIPIYLLSYPYGKESILSIGTIINLNIYNIAHSCSTCASCSGGPIINLNNYKVVGVQVKKAKYNYNLGVFLKYPLDDFKKNELKKI